MLSCKPLTLRLTFSLLQVQQHLEGPIGMALYEWQDGKIGMACVHGGDCHKPLPPHDAQMTYHPTSAWLA